MEITGRQGEIDPPEKFYRKLFETNERFSGPCIDIMVGALAKFERTLVSGGANHEAIEALRRAAGELGIKGQ